MTRETRRDRHLDTIVHIVADRQHRPNLPAGQCPFCVGGLEAPEPYVTKAFPNRWPPLDDGHCEVLLYSPDHDASLHSIGVAGVSRVIELWIERTAALRGLTGGEHVLIFENRGAEVGATIPHPHGQVYAFDHVPERPRRQLEAHWTPDPDPGERLVSKSDRWIAWTEHASVHPVSLRIAPHRQVADLAGLDTHERTELAEMLVGTLGALDAMFAAPAPYMMWVNQSPRDSRAWPQAWLNIEIVSPWRATGVARYIAAAEVATGEFFNPVDPADVAARLRTKLS